MTDSPMARRAGGGGRREPEEGASFRRDHCRGEINHGGEATCASPCISPYEFSSARMQGRLEMTLPPMAS
jgi:hypothetical protein